MYLVVERESGPVSVGALDNAEVCPREIREYDQYEFII